MASSHSTIREELINAARYIKARGLTPGHTGNVSVRVPGSNKAGDFKMLITPTGLPYDQLLPEDLVIVSNDGTWPDRGLLPSSEWQFHLAALKANPEVNALVHTHSNYATTLACARQKIPAFHYMVAAAGGDSIPLVPYHIFGSEALSKAVAKAFSNRRACLLAHHGQLAGERTLAKAVELAEIIEDLAQQYWALQQIAEPKLLSKKQMNDVLAKFQTYGQQKSGT